MSALAAFFAGVRRALFPLGRVKGERVAGADGVECLTFGTHRSNRSNDSNVHDMCDSCGERRGYSGSEAAPLAFSFSVKAAEVPVEGEGPFWVALLESGELMFSVGATFAEARWAAEVVHGEARVAALEWRGPLLTVEAAWRAVAELRQTKRDEGGAL